MAYRTLVTIVVPVLVALGCGSSKPSASFGSRPASSMGRVIGQVVEAQTGAPVVDADVEWSRHARAYARGR